MSWKLNAEDENPLWRQYMDELETMNPEESRKWEVVRELPVDLPFKTTTSNYSEDEFEQMLISDIQFNEKWGTIKNS